MLQGHHRPHVFHPVLKVLSGPLGIDIHTRLLQLAGPADESDSDLVHFALFLSSDLLYRMFI